MAKKKGDEEFGVAILPVLPEDSKIPALDLVPYVAENQVVELRGNFDVVKAALEARRDEVLQMKVSAKNMETVEKLKKEAMGYRTYLTETETVGKRKFFNAPKDIYSGKVATLLAIVAVMEEKAQKVLDKLETERRDELTGVFNIYKDEFQKTYNLSPEGLATIEFRPQYYNKTAKEKDSKEDLESQFIIRSDVEKALALGEKTIRQLCNGKPLLNVDRYVSDLKGGKELALVMDDIAAEEERLASVQKVIEVDAEPVNETLVATGQDGEVIKVGVLGVASRVLTGKPDFPGRVRKMKIELEYPSEFGSALSEIFQALAGYGIKSRNLDTF